jgi:glycosyltransferase involved in cell wall biosynthesis
MKLLFINSSQVRFTTDMPEREPLGGSESAAAYLARALAARNHDVTLMARLPDGAQQRIAGIRHVPLELAQDAGFFADAGFDAVVALSAPQAAAHLKQMAPGALHVAWLHLPPAPAVRDLILRHDLDRCIFVSAVQRDAVGFSGRSHVIGNGIAPSFENMFASASQLRTAKQNSAAYASVPDRGLDVLAEVIAATRLDMTFEIYSSMRIYQHVEDPFAPLYARLEAMPNCRYHGAVGQAALAGALRSAAFLAYPCTVGETYGIVVQEAMAAGLKVITTDLGNLRHTTMGFADIVPPGDIARFTGALEQAVADFKTNPDAWAEARFDQMQVINRDCSWAVRAREWEDYLARELRG